MIKSHKLIITLKDINGLLEIIGVKILWENILEQTAFAVKPTKY